MANADNERLVRCRNVNGETKLPLSVESVIWTPAVGLTWRACKR